MLEVQVRERVAPADVATVRRVADAAEAVDGHPSLGDAVWRDLADPSERSVLFVAVADDDAVGALHLASADGIEPGRLTAAIVVDPAHRNRGVARQLVEEALAHIDAAGGAHLVLWALGADGRADALAATTGFRVGRELWQMLVTLPISEEPRWPPRTTVRPFRPGDDEAAWLSVNNRAFRDDPDQGGWDETTLRRREAEPWFDPRGFLLAIVEESIAGFCWTKVHAPAPRHAPEPLGEIYVIGVDPDHRGRGLGRALVVAGLAHLHDDRKVRAGMLFVDAANAPAVALYRALGFTIGRVDRAYERDVP